MHEICTVLKLLHTYHSYLTIISKFVIMLYTISYAVEHVCIASRLRYNVSATYCIQETQKEIIEGENFLENLEFLSNFLDGNNFPGFTFYSHLEWLSLSTNIKVLSL